MFWNFHCVASHWWRSSWENLFWSCYECWKLKQFAWNFRRFNFSKYFRVGRRIHGGDIKKFRHWGCVKCVACWVWETSMHVGAGFASAGVNYSSPTIHGGHTLHPAPAACHGGSTGLRLPTCTNSGGCTDCKYFIRFSEVWSPQDHNACLCFANAKSLLHMNFYN